MAEDKQKRNKSHYEWEKNNTIRVNLKLSFNTDADILKASDGVEPRATILKRLIRAGIYATERNLIADDIMRQIIE